TRGGRTGDQPMSKLQGYAVVFDRTFDAGDELVRIAPNAFMASAAPIRFCVDHDKSAPSIAWTQNGSMRHLTDAYGLGIEVDIPDSDEGRALEDEVLSGRRCGLSIGLADRGNVGEIVIERGRNVRVWRAIQLAEISLVCAPSNPDCHAWLDIEPLEYLSEGQQVTRSEWRGAGGGGGKKGRTTPHRRAGAAPA